jgi:hypothetical protein
MINLFLGCLTAMLVCFVLALVMAAARHKKAAIRLALAGFGFMLAAVALVVLAMWMVAYGH